MSVSSFEGLKTHIGHKVQVNSYEKDGVIWNVAIECMDCNEVLLDFDADEPCPDCFGTGWLDGDIYEDTPCPICGGTGEL